MGDICLLKGLTKFTLFETVYVTILKMKTEIFTTFCKTKGKKKHFIPGPSPNPNPFPYRLANKLFRTTSTLYGLMY